MVGAGRPVDEKGIPQGPWTPDLLAEAISQIDANQSGIELRTVQHWFQDNKKGISAENIRWLARIFGCDDPDATSAWQAELSAANRRLGAKRREVQRIGGSSKSTSPETSLKKGTPSAVLKRDLVPRNMEPRRWLARRTEAMFDGQNALNLPIVVWAGSAMLAFLSYVIGTHSITYYPVPGLEKQVGFLWAPSWTVDRIVFVALFLFITSEVLHRWKTDWRPSVAVGCEWASHNEWVRRLNDLSHMFGVILGICALVVFFGQWLGVYWPVLIRGVGGSSMVDWILVAIERPDVVTVPEAIAVSGVANLYSCFVYWAYFSGLLLLFAVAGDFHALAGSPVAEPSYDRILGVFDIGNNLTRAVYCCAMLGILSATSIKLNAAYLISDGQNILAWLLTDMLTVLGGTERRWSFLEQTAWPYITSFFVFFVTVFTYFACLARIQSGLAKASQHFARFHPTKLQRSRELMRTSRSTWIRLSGAVGLLAVNFLLLGAFNGFSYLLILSVVVAVATVFSSDAKSPANPGRL